MAKEVWIVIGRTSGLIENQPPDLVEYQFSDGPAGNRSYSKDYTSLTEGLKEHDGCIIHWDTSNVSCVAVACSDFDGQPYSQDDPLCHECRAHENIVLGLIQTLPPENLP